MLECIMPGCGLRWPFARLKVTVQQMTERGAPNRVRRGEPLDRKYHRSVWPVKVLAVTHRHRARSISVVSATQPDEQVFLWFPRVEPIPYRHLERRLQRRRPRVGIEDLVQPP